jgi:hypothetical protein
LLGDDIVIANKQVADSYLLLMDDLGVDINLSKSLVSVDGALEFAKKLYKDNIDLSPLGPKSLFEFINSPLHFKDIIINYELYSRDSLDFVDSAVLVEQLSTLFTQAET